MDVLVRNNVQIQGKNDRQTMLFAHGFGCDQQMWRYVTPAFEDDYRVVLFDHVGAGRSDLSAYSVDKYKRLEGYAADIIEILDELQLTGVIYVGHSVSALMGIIAAIDRPDLFSHLILVGPSPCYINDGDYIGGFDRAEIEELLESLENNHLGWSMAMAPVIMGNPDRKELGEELSNSFCRTDPGIARHFAETTFFSDGRTYLSKNTTPALILQCSDDVIAPVSVGEYMHETMPYTELTIMEATGHCPNLSAPAETIRLIRDYLTANAS